MPNSLIFCIPVKNCIINRTATLDRPQGLEPPNHFDPSLSCLPPKGRTSNFFASCSSILQCLNSLTAKFSSSYMNGAVPGLEAPGRPSPRTRQAAIPSHPTREAWTAGTAQRLRALQWSMPACGPWLLWMLHTFHPNRFHPTCVFSGVQFKTQFACFLWACWASWTSLGNEFKPAVLRKKKIIQTKKRLRGTTISRQKMSFIRNMGERYNGIFLPLREPHTVTGRVSS